MPQASKSAPSPCYRDSSTIFWMQLTEGDIREFQAVWRSVFNEELSAADASYHFSGLVELYRALARPLPADLGKCKSSNS